MVPFLIVRIILITLISWLTNYILFLFSYVSKDRSLENVNEPLKPLNNDNKSPIHRLSVSSPVSFTFINLLL